MDYPSRVSVWIIVGSNLNYTWFVVKVFLTQKDSGGGIKLFDDQ